MKKSLKILIISLIVLIVGILVFLIIKNKSNDNNNEVKKSNIIYNDNIGIVEDKIINNVLFTDISCGIEDGNTTIKYKVVNNNSESITLGDYKLIFMNDNDEVVGEMNASVSMVIESNNSLNVENAVTVDLRNATKIRIELGDE
jgi:hypothetical protein